MQAQKKRGGLWWTYENTVQVLHRGVRFGFSTVTIDKIDFSIGTINNSCYTLFCLSQIQSISRVPLHAFRFLVPIQRYHLPIPQCLYTFYIVASVGGGGDFVRSLRTFPAQQGGFLQSFLGQEVRETVFVSLIYSCFEVRFCCV